LWQLGNETSYGSGGFTKTQSIETTIEFAKAMQQRDPSVELIGWGDSGWAAELVHQAGDLINFVAVHMMGQTPLRKDTVLNGFAYQNAPERAWEELMEITSGRIERKLLTVEAELDGQNCKLPVAITEGHLSLSPHNANPILTEWLTGVYHARALNLYQRHGNRVQICTAADFNGSRWTTNALMLQVPSGGSYLLPAGAVMRLFKRYNGKQGIAVKSAPSGLDVAASRDGNKIVLHVANMNYSRSIETTFVCAGLPVTSGKVFEIAPENPRQEISPRNQKIFDPVEHAIPSAEPLRWHFPARSVSAVELKCSPA
jgi:hypothetical protein